jgi:nitronate monooxygenase
MPENGSATKSWRTTRVTSLLGIDYPIIQAPFGGLPSQRLTATVSDLGCLGSLGALTLGRSAIQEAIGEIRSLTSKPFAINFWVSTSDRNAASVPQETIEERIRSYAKYYAELGIEAPSKMEVLHQDFEDQVQAAIDARSPVISFFYGIPPQDVLKECRKKAIKTIAAATTPAEAVALEESGADFIVATGFEAGAHRGSFLHPPSESLIGGLSLIPQVVDAVKVPVIAAGGIADGRGLAAALALGAEAAQIGTAFLACDGSGASDALRKALLREDAEKVTNLTDAFTGRLARGFRNRLMNELGGVNNPVLPFPLQHSLIQTIAAPASRLAKTELMTLWAGQSASLCHYADASELISHIIAVANRILGDS